MGARLVTLVLTYWTGLPDRQFRILLRMAHTALDTPSDDGKKPAEMYWGGHELLAMTLGCPYPDGDGAEARRARAGVLREVRREVAALRKAGACRVVDTGRVVRQGHSQTYLLTLWQPDRAGPQRTSSAGPLPSDSAGGQNPSSAGAQNPSSAGGLSPSEQGVTAPPRNQEEPSQELSHLHSESDRRSEVQVEGGSSPPAPDDPESSSQPDRAGNPRTREGTDAERRRQADALTEWIRDHPEAAAGPTAPGKDDDD
jgi:hypothetical protein